MKSLTTFLLTIFTCTTAFAQIELRIIDACEKLKRDAALPAHASFFETRSQTVHLAGAKNEVLAFQIILVSNQKAENLNFQTTYLVGKNGVIHFNQIEFFRAWYLNVTEPSTAMYGNPSSTGPGWYPDPLLPFATAAGAVGAPFVLEPGQLQSVWVDLYIPPETAAGKFSGRIQLLKNEIELTKINVELEVWDFALPDTTHLATFFYFGPEQLRLAHGLTKSTPSAEAMNLAYLRLAHTHRINLATDIHFSENPAYFETNWSPVLDGTAFTDGPGKGVGSAIWPVRISIWDGKAHFQQEAETTMNFFTQHGWTDKPFLYVIDEPGEDEYPEVRKVGGWLDDTPFPGNLLPFMLTEPFSPDLAGYVDIWNSGRIQSQEIQQRQASHDQFWTYNGGQPGSGSQCIDTDGWALRSWPWIAWKGNRAAWHYWDCCYFRDRANGRGEINVWENPLTFDQRPKNDVDWGNGDGTLFYPGQQVNFGTHFFPGPVSSFRMKAFRQGMQDYEYLWLARQRATPEQIEAIVNQVIPHPVLGDAQPGQTCYVQSAEPWARARQELAKLILAKRK
jgi:hypothetical protein